MTAPQSNTGHQRAAGAAGGYSGILRVTDAVILSGQWLPIVRRAVIVADAARRRNGVAPSPDYAALLAAVDSAMAAAGRADTVAASDATHSPHDNLTITEAARRLGVSTRQCRRIADKLGGRKLGGNWIVSAAAVAAYHSDPPA